MYAAFGVLDILVFPVAFNQPRKLFPRKSFGVRGQRSLFNALVTNHIGRGYAALRSSVQNDPNVLPLQFSLDLQPQHARFPSAFLETRGERSTGYPYAKRWGNRKLGRLAATAETRPRLAECAETSQD
jgi:hypothetical protein